MNTMMNAPAQNDRNYAMYQNAIFWVEEERIVPNPFQPRRTFNEDQLKDLAESIRMYGLLQPLTVTKREKPGENGGIRVEYELIAGERRLRASRIAGLSQVPVIIRTGEETDQMKLELAIIENLQREDLNAVDRAEAFQKLYKDFGFTHKQIGVKMGKSREYVANTLRLLNLPEHIQTYLREGRINEGHTRPLLMINDKPEEQAVLLKEIVIKKISVREAERLARHSAQEKVRRDYHRLSPEIVSLERSLTETLGTRVTIEPRETGGRVVISFFSPEDLQALLQAIQKKEQGHGVAVAAQQVEREEMEEKTEISEMPTEKKDDAMMAFVSATPIAFVEEEMPDTASEGAQNTPEVAVEPSEERPFPETEEVAPATDTVHIQEREEEIAREMQRQEEQEEERATSKTENNPPKEDDSDLYSLRNFTI